MTRLLIVARSAVMRAGLASLLGSHPTLSLAADPVDAAGLDAALDEAAPDLLLAVVGPDDRLPGGPPPKVLLASDPQASWIREGFGTTVLGVLPQDAAPEEILAACEAAAVGLAAARTEDIRGLAAGGGPSAGGVREIPPNIPGARAARSDPGPALTPREIEVLRMIADGLGNKGIAFRLGISEHTVKFHVASIMVKLGAASRTEAVTEGFRRGLILL